MRALTGPAVAFCLLTLPAAGASAGEPPRTAPGGPPLPAQTLLAQAGGVHGQDVMEDRNKAGPDGAVQAPIPRVDAPSGSAPGEANPNRSADTQNRPVPDTGRHLTPGQNPATPMPSNTLTPATKP